MRPAAVVLLVLLSCGPVTSGIDCVPDCCLASASDGEAPSCAAMKGAAAGECQLQGCAPDTRIMTLGAALPGIIAPSSPSLTLERSGDHGLVLTLGLSSRRLASVIPPPRA